MTTQSFILKNDGFNVFNDVVLEGFPFVRNNDVFLFDISPKTDYWRFGLRFSKNPQIDFLSPEGRYMRKEDNKYIDLHIGAGIFDGILWGSSDYFQVTQYNLDLDPINMGDTNLYERKSRLTWNLDFSESGEFVKSSVNIFDTSIELFSNPISIPKEYKYFQVFAWADLAEFELVCGVDVSTGQNVYTDIDFEVGNIVFRHGDILDFEVTSKTNVFIFPASSSGTTSSTYLGKATELKIPFPRNNKLGALDLFSLPDSKSWARAGYLYSDDGDTSTYSAVFQASNSLLLEIENNQSEFKNCIGVSLPLVYNEFQGILPHEIALIYDKVFNRSQNSIKFFVSILDAEAFSKIRLMYVGRITSSLTPDIILRRQYREQIAIRLNIDISSLYIDVDPSENLVGLHFQNCLIKTENLLGYCNEVHTMSFTSCEIDSFEFLKKLSSIRNLSFSEMDKIDVISLRSLSQIRSLEIRYSDLSDINIFAKFKNLAHLTLNGFNTLTISNLTKLTSLKSLDLTDNNITNISPLSKLKKLRSLVLRSNNISSIDSIGQLRELEFLDLSENKIKDLMPLIQLRNLEYLKINRNSFESQEKLSMPENENHYKYISNYLERKTETDRREVKLPAKIVLLGNHGAGKSSLLHFILNNTLIDDMQSTHLIRIEKYFEKNTDQLPSAMYFDFGGQDYYHGVYKAFLSGGSAYLLLYQPKNNENQTRLDLNNILTQDFCLDYWLSQKSYFEIEKFGGVSDPLFLIQTFADKHPRQFFVKDGFSIADHFYVSLSTQTEENSVIKAKLSLELLRLEILELLDKVRVRVTRPKWFLDFLNYILTSQDNDTHVPRSVDSLMEYYISPYRNAEELLMEDLDQLHRQGIVLYYRHFLPQKVWLNPIALVDYIHENILGKSVLQKSGRIAVEDLKNISTDVVNIMRLQKVLYYHENGENGAEYIVPNYLPLFKDGEPVSKLLFFGLGDPVFTLKFRNFLPFGLINQLICFFGNLPSKKKFWRDRLVFSFEERAKILVDVDMGFLEIKVFCDYDKGISNNEKDSIERYIFFSIVGLYWDLQMPSYRDFNLIINEKIKKESLYDQPSKLKEIINCEKLFDDKACRPNDLFLSLDNLNFISYCELCDSNSNLMIGAMKVNEKSRTFSNEKSILPIFTFQKFIRRQLKRRLKPVISYSKQDLKMVDEFRRYLTPLYDKGLIENPWFCTQLLAGEEWNNKIQQEFDQADIIFFMVSDHLMSTQYVKDFEIKKAIDKYDRGDEIMIIPILLVPFNFEGPHPYNLTRFTALPYSLKPITEFPNRKLGWHIVSESIRIAIERKINTTKIEDPFYSQFYRYLEAIINSKDILEGDRL